VANTDLMRIRSSVLAHDILGTLRQVNSDLATHQLRLGTGSRINRAGDDPAGLSISTKLRARYRVWDALYDNVGQARNMLSVAEGALLEMNQILTAMNEKIVMAATDSLGTDERRAISQQVAELLDEVSDIVEQTEFNGVKLLDETASFTFQISPEGQLSWSTQPFSTSALELSHLETFTTDTIITTGNYMTYYDEVNEAIDQVSGGLTVIGSLLNRLSAKEQVISVASANTKAAYSRIRDADMASEQLALTKSQVLQQTSLAVLTQANANPQSVLTLFR